MDVSEVAEKMMEVLAEPSQWNKGALVNHSPTRRCLLGARVHVDGWLYTKTAEAAEEYIHDPYMILLSRIIMEQHPKLLKLWAGSPAPVIVVSFNDDTATTFVDIRAVLEKAHAEAAVSGLSLP